ncbi:Proliferation marker protein Ki-67, partial [Varanus komodoensis]
HAKHFPELCCIVSLDYADNVNHPEKLVEQPTGIIADAEIKTDTCGSMETVLPTPKTNGESFQANLNSCYRSTRRSSNLQVELDSLTEMKSSAESPAVIEKCSVHVSTGEHEYDLIENKYSKAKGNNQMSASEPTQILKEMRNESCANYTTKDGRNTTSLLYYSNGKSLRRSFKQDKDFSNGRSFIQEIPTEGPDSSPTERITPKQLHSENGGNWPQEVNIVKGPATDRHEQHMDMKNIPALFSITDSGHKSSDQIQAGNEAVSEMNVSNPFSVKRKSVVKKSPQKRKGKEPDLLNQPPGKRKRVSFGGQLSPELFDKRLPPNSPLKRGAIPARLSLPFGNSPRAVLKKVSGVRHSVMKSFSEQEQDKNILPQTSSAFLTCSSLSTSSPACRFPPISPPVLIPCNKLQSQVRFSVSHVTGPSSLEEQGTIATQEHIKKEFAVNIPEPTEEEPKPTESIRRSQQFASRRSSLRRRSSAMDAIHSRRRSGASEANLIVAKSWAEVVKQGVPKPCVRSTKCSLQRLTKKVLAKPSKNNVFTLKTPVRKVKGHFTTGHVNSPAPIVIGKAHTRLVNVAAQVPKVMLSCPLKQHCDLDESFTGMAEMFNTSLNGKPKSSLSHAQRMKMAESDVTSKMHTSEESGIHILYKPLVLAVRC